MRHSEDFVCHGINTRDSGMGYQCTRQEYIVRATMCREHTLGTSFKSRALCSNTGELMNTRMSYPGLVCSVCFFKWKAGCGRRGNWPPVAALKGEVPPSGTCVSELGGGFKTQCMLKVSFLRYCRAKMKMNWETNTCLRLGGMRWS
jgi:hypothetical protein